MTIEQIENVAFVAGTDMSEAKDIINLLKNSNMPYLAQFVETLADELEAKEDWIDPQDFDGEVSGEYWIHPDSIGDYIDDNGYTSKDNVNDFIQYWDGFLDQEIKQKKIGNTTFYIAEESGVNSLMSKYHELLD